MAKFQRLCSLVRLVSLLFVSFSNTENGITAFVLPKLAKQTSRRTNAVVARKRIAAALRNETTSSVVDDRDDFLSIAEPGLLVTDIVSISIASQLLGLLDVLNDPTFWDNGGWLQGIKMPATLPTLIQRDSILSICWVMAALLTGGYAQTEVSIRNSALRSTLFRTSGVFALLRVVAGIALDGSNDVADALDLFQQCYTTILMVGVFRFLYRQLYDNR
jgi:hypothetical protein